MPPLPTGARSRAFDRIEKPASHATPGFSLLGTRRAERQRVGAFGRLEVQLDRAACAANRRRFSHYIRRWTFDVRCSTFILSECGTSNVQRPTSNIERSPECNAAGRLLAHASRHGPSPGKLLPLRKTISDCSPSRRPWRRCRWSFPTRRPCRSRSWRSGPSRRPPDGTSACWGRRRS